MIYVIRPKMAPEYLSKKSIAPYFKEMDDFYKRRVKSRLQERFEFDYPHMSKARAHFGILFHDKCAYCERKIPRDESILDNFRPRSHAKGLNGETSDNHYWWLYTEWRNMYYACRDCNRFKTVWFPVKGKRCKIKASYGEVIKEEALLIDPCIDQPHRHLDFKVDGKVYAKSEKGEVTIDLLKLNRSDLVNDRLKAIATFKKWLVEFRAYAYGHSAEVAYFPAYLEFGKYIAQALEDNSATEFCGAFRSLIIAEWEQVPDFKTALRTYLDRQNFTSRFYTIVRRGAGKPFTVAGRRGYKTVSAPPNEVKERPYKKLSVREPQNTERKKGSILESIIQAERQNISFTIEKIEISNFRMIEALTVEFPSASRQTSQTSQSTAPSIYEPWLMILGENGVGKSSILQAIALVLMGGTYLKKLNLKLDDFLKYGAEEGYVRVYEFGNDVPYSIEYNRTTGKVTSSVPNTVVNLLGYGSIRLFPTPVHKPEQNRGKARVMNLFDPHVPLIDSGKWLAAQHNLGRKNEARSKQFERIALAIKDLLMLGQEERIVVEGSKARILQKSGNHIPISVISEGYKSIMSVVVDIMHAINKVNTSLETAQGIVLMDEIGTHLHPRWRMQVVNRFRKVFPRMQFIVTTHDPLCLRGLANGEVIVLRKTPEDKVYQLTELPDPAGLNAEQLLGSEYFGLSSTYEPEDEEKLNEYHFLLTKVTLNKKEERRKRELEVFVRKKNKIGDNLYEQALHEVVQQKVAETKFQTPETKIELNKSTIDKIKSIWEGVES